MFLLLNFETEAKSQVALTQKCNKHMLTMTEQQQQQFCQASVPCLLYTATTKIYAAHISACNSSYYQLSTNTTKPICRLYYFHTFSPPFTENSCLPGILAAIKITRDENQISWYSKNGVFKERSSLLLALLSQQVSLTVPATKSKAVLCLCLTRQIKHNVFKDA